MKRGKRFDTCQKMRRVRITKHIFNVVTGESTPDSVEWKTQPCGTPLFTEAEETSGICRSCASGWTHPFNYPVTEAK